ncbi:MAG TPA: hypothetical protein VJ742_12745 [Nitrososphaera sp.]|nr:hypothetical protein [Nitrososphaera sp.]
MAWFRRKKKEATRLRIAPVQVQSEDPLIREVVAQTFNTGQPHVAYYDDDNDGRMVVEPRPEPECEPENVETATDTTVAEATSYDSGSSYDSGGSYDSGSSGGDSGGGDAGGSCD